MLAKHEWPPVRTAAGAAAPVAVLVHGITGWLRTWWRVAPALAERDWRVVALDLRGHGGSPRISRRFTGESLAADVGATIDSWGVARVDVLIGHSLGAAVVLELAHRRPDIARRLVLEDPPGSSRVDDLAFQEHLEAEVLAARRDPEAEIDRALVENPTWLGEDARQNVEAQVACDLDGILASLRSGTGLRVADLVPIIKIPALYLLASEGRSAISDEQRARLLRGIPEGSRVVEIDSGHTIHRDQFDAYLATALAWLEGT